MKLVVANRTGRRGEGLGNEMIPWAKGWIASQALDARVIGPSWGINKRRYYRNFGTSRLDFLIEDLLSHLPHYAFTEEEYRSTGIVDFGSAIRQWAERKLHRKRSFIVTVGGMWGGYGAIRSARTFLLGKLINSRDTMRNFYEVLSKIERNKLFVAVHMRTAASEFRTLEPDEDSRGKFNIFDPS